MNTSDVTKTISKTIANPRMSEPKLSINHVGLTTSAKAELGYATGALCIIIIIIIMPFV